MERHYDNLQTMPLHTAAFGRGIIMLHELHFALSVEFGKFWCDVLLDFCAFVGLFLQVPRRQPHCRSGLATLPFVGAIP